MLRQNDTVFRKRLAISASFCVFVVATTPVHSQQSKLPATKNVEQPKLSSGKTAENDINAQFANPDAKAFVKRFESESREVYTRRKEIVRALEIKRGQTVADIGAGTGLFTKLIAEEVGTAGKVYAVDIAATFLKHIEDESKRLKQPQVRTIKATQDSTGLPANSCDLAFICDVYHHFERPIESLRSIHDALKETGELVVIDFDRVKGKSSEFVLKHVRADRSQFIKEIQSAGFLRVRATNAPDLSENFFLKFKKIDRAPSGPNNPVGG